ncbi:hypothetical protein BSLG_005908 [Batrachochytrium salamandrivorans]|nr:hypothetical protein BSLG_005908 [Batrachochytrium salamandrivorans]
MSFTADTSFPQCKTLVSIPSDSILSEPSSTLEPAQQSSSTDLSCRITNGNPSTPPSAVNAGRRRSLIVVGIVICISAVWIRSDCVLKLLAITLLFNRISRPSSKKLLTISTRNLLFWNPSPDACAPNFAFKESMLPVMIELLKTRKYEITL